jgi:hypothetical protein
MRPADTSPEMWDKFIELQRRQTAREKSNRVFELTRTVRSAAEAGLRRRHPQATPREIFLMRVRNEIGADLFHKAYGDALPRQ